MTRVTLFIVTFFRECVVAVVTSPHAMDTETTHFHYRPHSSLFFV